MSSYQNPSIRAPALQVGTWLNTPSPLDLHSLRGRVVLLHAFQMLCPGCVSDALPQAERIHRLFKDDGVAVIGLHTVFEHHDVMGLEALRAFVHEYRWSFPIATDRPVAGSPVPATMQAYQLQGTPSLVLLDRAGDVRLRHFGRVDDLMLGSLIGRLLGEAAVVPTMEADTSSVTGCADGACAVNHA